MQDQKIITSEEAINLLPEGDSVHTYRTLAGILIGADWNRDSLIEAINEFAETLELTGETARAMRHGLALEDNHGYLFIETDAVKINAFF